MLFGLASELLREFVLKAESCGLDQPLALPVLGRWAAGTSQMEPGSF